jgi:lipopolysaccharide export system protein LptA
MKAAVAAAAAAWLLLAPLPAAAQAIDLSSGGPVQVTARDGFEWRETEQKVIASGDARAVRGDVTVLADRLVAYYRKKAAGPGGAAGLATPPPGPPAASPGAAEEGSNEVYRLEAEGHVRIVTPTDEAVGDQAVYDIDQSVLVMTGHALKLTTPNDVLTARDSMEYWSQRHMAVGRGDAVVVTNDGRRLAADVLVAYTVDANQPGATKVATAAAAPAAGAAGKAADPLVASAGKLERVEAYGNVEVRTQVDIVRGDRGVYVPDTGVARVFGHVRVTHGQNQINGPAADVNMKTGIAHVLSSPSERVEGLIVPNAAENPAAKPTGKAAAGPTP